MSSQGFIIHFLYFYIFLKFSMTKSWKNSSSNAWFYRGINVFFSRTTSACTSVYYLFQSAMYWYRLFTPREWALWGQAHIIFIFVAFPACFTYNWHLILSAEVIWKKTKTKETRKKNSNRSTFHSWSKLNLKDFYRINCTIYIELLGWL